MIQDAEVPLNGFLVIQAKEHKNSILNYNKEEAEELIELVYKTRKALEDLKICKEVTIVQEERSKHFHIWMFPYYDWMSEKFGKGIEYLRNINKYVTENATIEERKEVEETVEKLKRYFNKENI